MPSSKESLPEYELHKFPKIKYPNDPETDGLFNEDVVVTEKLDGGNFRFTWNTAGELICGSRNVAFVHGNSPLPIEEINADFQHSVEAVSAIVPDEVPFDPTRYTFFGESMQLHSLQYDGIDYTQSDSGSPFPAQAEDSVVLFDAWDHEDKRWVEWDHFKLITDELGLQTTREIAFGNEDFIRENDCLEIPDESMFGTETAPEGIVVRRIDGQVRAKKVSEDFREKNAIAFNSPSQAQSDAAEFVAMFVTPARIKSVAHSLVEDEVYEKLEMPMMEDLPRAVLEDILEEEGWNLMCNEYNYEAELDDEWKSEVRSRTSKACARHLKEEINKF